MNGYRIQMSSLGGERIYRNYRYSIEDGKRHKVYAEGIYNNFESCMKENLKLNGGQNVLCLQE